MEKNSELVKSLVDYLSNNPSALDWPSTFIDYTVDNQRVLLYIKTGRMLKIKGIILNSEFSEGDILNLFTSITCGELYEDFCPDNDNISWAYLMGNSFHGIPNSYEFLLDNFRVPYTKLHGSLELEENSDSAQFFTIALTDYAS